MFWPFGVDKAFILQADVGVKRAWILCACFRVRVQKLFLSSRPLPVRRSAVAF